MTSALLAVVYGDPLSDDLTRSLSTAGLDVVHPSRSTGIPRVADIDALLVRVEPESLNGSTDPRTSDVMADVTLRELARSRRRARRGRTQSARVDAIIVPPDPDLDGLTRKVQASIDGSSEGVIELAHSSGSVSGLRGTGSGTEG
ncbi:hypothetical protein [Herbiconiux sp.]|uniref:hypothetical protein n=1 Tax=Herbiconiux sp. TaxID=1871186 RepID=UPI0025C00722|nr:hypothetical protein [Herbiconiux sp.]